MDLCQSNMITNTSSIYSCSKDHQLIHTRWNNNTLCFGDPYSIANDECSSPDCICGHGEDCAVWSYEEYDCSSEILLSSITLVTNSCFNRKYRNICNEEGELILEEYAENECQGQMTRSVDIGANTNETLNDDDCTEYHCNVSASYSYQQIPNDTDLFEDEDVAIGTNWVLLFVTAFLVCTFMFYCYKLKPPTLRQMYAEIDQNQ